MCKKQMYHKNIIDSTKIKESVQLLLDCQSFLAKKGRLETVYCFRV